MLRNSLIPIATLLGLQLPAIMSGALITESVFNYPGMGLLFYKQAQKQDYPTLLGIIIVVALATVDRLAARRHRVRGARPAGEVPMSS